MKSFEKLKISKIKNMLRLKIKKVSKITDVLIKKAYFEKRNIFFSLHISVIYEEAEEAK